jgi:hypothetical protein
VPIQVERDAMRRMLNARAIGALTVEDILAFISGEWASAPEGYGILFDARNTDVQVTAGGIRRLAEFTRTTTLELRAPVAIVTSTDHHFGLARMYQALCDISNSAMVHAGRTIADGEAWLRARLAEQFVEKP